MGGIIASLVGFSPIFPRFSLPMPEDSGLATAAAAAALGALWRWDDARGVREVHLRPGLLFHRYLTCHKWTFRANRCVTESSN